MLHISWWEAEERLHCIFHMGYTLVCLSVTNIQTWAALPPSHLFNQTMVAIIYYLFIQSIPTFLLYTIYHLSIGIYTYITEVLHFYFRHYRSTLPVSIFICKIMKIKTSPPTGVFRLQSRNIRKICNNFVLKFFLDI